MVDEELMKYSRELEEDLDVNRSGDLRELVDEFGTSQMGDCQLSLFIRPTGFGIWVPRYIDLYLLIYILTVLQCSMLQCVTVYILGIQVYRFLGTISYCRCVLRLLSIICVALSWLSVLLVLLYKFVYRWLWTFIFVQFCGRFLYYLDYRQR